MKEEVKEEDHRKKREKNTKNKLNQPSIVIQVKSSHEPCTRSREHSKIANSKYFKGPTGTFYFNSFIIFPFFLALFNNTTSHSYPQSNCSVTCTRGFHNTQTQTQTLHTHKVKMARVIYLRQVLNERERMFNLNTCFKRRRREYPCFIWHFFLPLHGTAHYSRT